MDKFFNHWLYQEGEMAMRPAGNGRQNMGCDPEGLKTALKASIQGTILSLERNLRPHGGVLQELVCL